MIHNIIYTVRSIPLRLHLLYVPIVLFTSFMMYYIFSRFLVEDILMQTIYNSTTLSMLHWSIINFIGFAMYDLLRQIGSLILFLSMNFFIWMRLCKRHISKVKQKHLQQLFTDIIAVANGNLQQTIRTNESSLQDIAQAINTIVQNLQQAMEEERHVEQTKNELITNVSHDLRTPLTSIIGYLTIIEEDKYRDEVELRRYTQIAFEKTLQMQRLIQELFEFTRMQDRRFLIEKTNINITEMVTQILVHHAISFEQSHVTIREDIPSTEMIIKGDGAKLARMVENLLTNAVKYGHADSYIDVSIQQDESYVTLAITNYGEPIPSIDLPHIFDRFYRSDKSRTDTQEGSGLGLAIVKSIVEAHNGTICVSSTYQGTTFTVNLPK